jgi:hypothetical protein
LANEVVHFLILPGAARLAAGRGAAAARARLGPAALSGAVAAFGRRFTAAAGTAAFIAGAADGQQHTLALVACARAALSAFGAVVGARIVTLPGFRIASTGNVTFVERGAGHRSTGAHLVAAGILGGASVPIAAGGVVVRFEYAADRWIA